MKNYKLLLSSAFIAGTFLFSASLYLKKTINFSPRFGEENESNELKEKQAALGAAQWLFDIQKNAQGIIDPNDVIKAREAVAQMKNMRSANALGLDWTDLGPDNVGGRTRAILVDKNNNNKLFAASVSGGLWVSNNGGANWTNAPGFDQQPLLSTTCIAQASNGDIYIGTGEDLYYLIGTGSAGILGGGIYKSTDDGASFTLLASTKSKPNYTNNATLNNDSCRFAGVNNIAVDPNNPNKVFAATKTGLQMSYDGGNTWYYPVRNINGTPVKTRATDVDVASDGTVIASLGGRGYMSATGDTASFSLIPNSAGLPTSGISRTEFAIAPSDPNYMYALVGKSSNGLLYGVYQSSNKGVSWTSIGNGGSSQFEPFGSASQSGQSDYDNTIAVYPNNRGKIIIGGVTLWSWEQTAINTPGVGQWNAIADQGEYPQNPYYVHSDVHTIKFNPSNPDMVYIGCDGGVFRGINVAPYGMVFQPMNNGYNVTQFYSVACAGDGVHGTGVLGGAQDNGTQYISGNGNTTKSADHVNGGDGAECEISYLNPNVSFTTVYYGSLSRHASKGGYGNSFYSWNIAHLLAANTLSASFVTPIALYETKTAANSPDSVMFINSKTSEMVAMGDGAKKHYTGTIVLPQPTATIVAGTIAITSGSLSVVDDGAGHLTGNVDNMQTNSINYATGTYDFYFNSSPASGASINVAFSVAYANNVQIKIERADYVDPLYFNAPHNINPGDTVMVYDPFQAKLAVGFTGSVYMTKGCLNFTSTPQWYKLGTIGTATAEELAWSADGDVLYVGTASGTLYRFSNLAAVKDSVTGDMASPSTVVVKTQIAGFGGRFITGLSVDPNNANNVTVALGNYGSTTYIYYCTNATTCPTAAGTSNFTAKQGNLPAMPVYSSLIESNDPKRVILGTEHGIFTTDDITAATPVWSADNGISGLFPDVPVFKVRQQRRSGYEVNNPYVIYAGSHGRGIWKCENYKGIVYVGIDNPGNSSKLTGTGITIYPNPMTNAGTVAFNLSSATEVVVSIYNLQGQLVSTIKPGKLSSGDQKIALNSSELAKGTYLLSIDGTNLHATSRFVVVK